MTIDKKIWIVGCGDIGKRVARLYAKSEKAIHGIVSSEESADKCEQLLIKSSVIDLDSTFSLDQHEFADTDLFYFAPPSATAAKDTRLKRFLIQLLELQQIPKRIVLISTTGVYGDSQGKWIDETTPINPQADRAVRRMSAEQILQRWVIQTNCEFIILRVPGIYAEDRLPLARLKKSLPVVNAEEAGFTNRIHADDLALACKAAMECEHYNHIINVTDGNPSTMTDYFNHVADYSKLPRPPQISLRQAEQELTTGMVSYLKESRRIRNNKMLNMLGIELRYPSLNESLKIKN